MASTKARLSQATAHLKTPATMAATNTVTLTHPTLPTLTGVASAVEGIPIAQFRGLQYGVIAKRFGAAVPLQYEGDGGGVGLDCTEFGYVCIF